MAVKHEIVKVGEKWRVAVRGHNGAVHFRSVKYTSKECADNSIKATLEARKQLLRIV